MSRILNAFLLVSGSVFEEESGYSLRVSPNADVHLRVRLLSQEEQPVFHLRG